MLEAPRNSDNQLEILFNEVLESAIPSGTLRPSSWAEQRRVLSLESVADPSLAGRWSNKKTPYMVEIMDAGCDPGINEVIVIKSAQVGGTEFGNNVIGFHIDVDPATILYVAEDEKKARAWSVEKLMPMLRDTPSLAAIMGVARERDSSNMIEAKAFRGGHLAIGWATSPATLSSRPRRIVILDEADAYKPTKEGSPIVLAEARMKTAGDQRLLIIITTPRRKETSQTLEMWEKSTQERYFVPCPHCQEYQYLKWANVIWDDDPLLAVYACDACGVAIENEDKEWMLEQGEWRSTNPDYVGNRRGFHINEIYSPFTKWGDMARAFVDAKPFPDKLEGFINTRLGEWWEERGEGVSYMDLSTHQETYNAEVPHGVLLLTAGIDVQNDRLECEIIGWGRDRENWSIDYRIFEGNPSLPDVWDDLSDHLQQVFEGEHGETFRVRGACIDTGGHHADDVYRFCKANAGRRWFAIKGASTAGKPIVSKPSRHNRHNVKIFSVGTDTAKDEIFSLLKIGEPGPGFCHFPDDDRYDTQFFKQLCSEKKVTRFTQGVKRQIWVKVNPDTGKESASLRNEVLDTRVYATAARAILLPNYDKWAATQSKKAGILPPVDTSKLPEDTEKSEPEAIATGEKPENAPKTGKKRRKVVLSNRVATRKNFGTSW